MDPYVRDSHLSVQWAARINYSKNSGVKPHVHHDLYQLLFILDGEGTITINGQSFPSLANHCYLFPQGVEHGFHFTQVATTLDFKFIMVKELSDCIFNQYQTGPLLVTNKNDWMRLFRLSCQFQHNQSNSFLPYQVDAGFKYLFLSILQGNSVRHLEMDGTSLENQPSSPQNPAIQELIDYLKTNLHSKINLDEIASRLGFHPHYLIELFRKELGTTPIQYLQLLRIDKSKEYLEFTNHSISEIAEMVGLTAPYFSRLFCDRIGISPSQYREKTRTVIGKNIILERDFTLESQPIILTL